MEMLPEARFGCSISRVLLQGLYDQGSSLHALLGFPHVMQIIWRLLTDYWRKMIKLPDVMTFNYDEDEILDENLQPFYLSVLSQEYADEPSCSFPPPSNININMMPFVVGRTFKDCRLPKYVRPYWSMLSACLAPHLYHSLWSPIESDIGKIYFLTIQESDVAAGTSQRRPGLHVDSPGFVNIRNEEIEDCSNCVRTLCESSIEGKGWAQPYTSHPWGQGCAHFARTQTARPQSGHYVMEGGIYLASSVPSSCRAWDCKVDSQAVSRLGDVEHLRHVLPGPGVELEARRIYWITDRTPHESLPLPEGGPRQFFRLVTSQVSLWYTDHSTANPLGVVPDPAITNTVRGDKFSQDGVEVVPVPVPVLPVTKLVKLKNKLKRQISKVQ